MSNRNNHVQRRKLDRDRVQMLQRKKTTPKKKKKKKIGVEKKKVEKNKTSTTKSFSKSRDQFLLCGDDRLNAQFFLPLPATAIPDRQKFRNKRSVRRPLLDRKLI